MHNEISFKYLLKKTLLIGAIIGIFYLLLLVVLYDYLLQNLILFPIFHIVFIILVSIVFAVLMKDNIEEYAQKKNVK